MGIPQEQILYLPNGPGIQTQHTSIAKENDRPPTLLLYSRLFEFETSRLVPILQQIVAAVPTARIRFVGTALVAQDTSAFRQQLQEADIADAVEDIGFVAREHLPTVLRAGDVGIYLMDDTLLNRTKCPVKLADMASMGIPVVGEAVGQVRDYVFHGRTGYLHPPGAEADIAADIIRLLQDKNESRRLGAAARLYIHKNFNWDRLADRLETAYLGH
jgi:glycosyltransferase involved in cell wall biosynthesis